MLHDTHSWLLALAATVATSLAYVGPATAQKIPSADRSIFIQSKLHGSVLDIKGASKAPVSPVVSYPRNAPGNTANQEWVLVPAGDGKHFFIQSRLNDMVLDIEGANTKPGARIITYPRKAAGTDNQQWALAPAGDGKHFFIASRMNGMVLDIEGKSQAPLAQIISFPRKATDTDNQLWRLVRAPRAPVVAQPPPAATKKAVNAGPIWNNDDAKGKCPRICLPPSRWNGQWWTTEPGKMSVCECETPVAPPPPPIVKTAVEAGPIWNNDDAKGKCPKLCLPPTRWNGQWWTTVQGKMSVCECEGPQR